MRIYAANSVFIEVTRRCNMCCAHCLRGDAESIDIQEKYIDAFLDSFEKGAYISSLTFTGGEISLNIPAIRYTLKAVKERGIAVGSFYMVTNGKAVDKMADLAMASLEWWNYCDDKDDYSCGLCISSEVKYPVKGMMNSDILYGGGFSTCNITPRSEENRIEEFIANNDSQLEDNRRIPIKYIPEVYYGNKLIWKNPDFANT